MKRTLRLSPGPLVAAAILSFARPGAAAADTSTCSPTVEGPADLVRDIVDRTSAIHVGSCRPLVARIRPDGDGFLVERLDGERVVESRRVEERSTAVTVIVSWARAAWTAEPPVQPEPPIVVPSDAAAETEPSPPPERKAAVVTRPPLPVTPPPNAPETSSTAPKRPVAAVVARIGLSLANDASLWADVTLGACGFVGPVCLGGYLRAPFDTISSGPGKDLESSRGGIDGLFGVEIPVVFDRIAFRPAVAAGAGWLRASGGSKDTSFVARDAAVGRVAAFARLGVNLVGIAWLEVGALADMGLGVPTDPALEEGVLLAGFPLFRAGIDATLRLEVP